MNDERIISLLENIQVEQQNANKRLNKIEGDIGSIQGDIGSIHGELENIKGELGNIKGDIENIQAEQQGTNKRLEKIEDDIEIIKESAEETRSATNRLLEWADLVEHKVGVPLFKMG